MTFADEAISAFDYRIYAIINQGEKMKTKIIITILIIVLFLLLWAPWMDAQTVHDKVFQERAHKDGTMAWVVYPDGTREYALICDYNVKWFPFGRVVANCEAMYFVTFWGKIIW